MSIIASLTNPIWQDTGVNVRVVEDAGRYEVRYPLISGETGIPDFTTPSDAIGYAEHVARTLRFTRNVAHGTAEKEDARRTVKTTRLDLVLRDATATRWVLVAPGLYALADWIKRGRPFKDFTRRTREQIEERYGATTVEHSIEIKGEPA